MPAPLTSYQNPEEATKGLTSAFSPTNSAQQVAIQNAANLVPVVSNPIYANQAGSPQFQQPAKEITSISSDKGQTIAENNQTAQNLATQQRGVTTSPDAVERYSNGAYAPAPSDAIQDETGVWRSQGRSYLVGPSTIKDPVEAEQNRLIEEAKSKADSLLTESLNSIQRQFSELRSKQRDINMRATAGLGQTLLMSGAQRYSASESGIMAGMESYGLEKLNELINQESNAVNAAKMAYEAGDAKRLDQKLSLLKETKAQQQKVAEELHTRLLEANKQVADEQRRQVESFNKTKTDTLLDIAKNGAPQAVREAVSKATNLSDLVNSAGDYLQVGTGIVNEYKFYVKDAIARKEVPISFDEYQTRDANRKLATAKATIEGTGLNTQQQAVFNKIVDKYNASPAIKALDRANQLKNILIDAEKNPSNAGSQLNLLYAYVKGLDTDSAVREGELDLVKSISNYFSKYEMYFAKLAKNQAVPNGVMTDMISGGKKLVASIEDTANRKKKVFQAQAKANGTQVDNAFSGFISNVELMGSLSDELVGEEKEAEKKVIEYGTNNQDNRDAIRQMVADKVPYSKIKKSLGI